ncbi:hypothetical protein L1887_27888 [Cichorium endivia]|nr:hypothetical protein L1887_27888 [Cichorium endivia]
MPSPRGSPAAPSTMSPPFSPPPMLHLHNGNLQESRLRLSFNAIDVHAEEPKLLLDLDMHQRQQAAVFSPVVVNQLSPLNPYSPKVDRSVNEGEPAPARRLQATEPDVSWVQSLVKEPPPSGNEPPETEKNDHDSCGVESMTREHTA